VLRSVSFYAKLHKTPQKNTTFIVYILIGQTEPGNTEDIEANVILSLRFHISQKLVNVYYYEQANCRCFLSSLQAKTG